ncbi:protein HLB1-like [Camellia sinensis]|uniref:protein HLB1-like n=1 Tax=Camellia sinensis TaxID=4442 RepID=UPI001035A0D6|nr:protein HLB1-like [Camellia sinensis]
MPGDSLWSCQTIEEANQNQCRDSLKGSYRNDVAVAQSGRLAPLLSQATKNYEKAVQLNWNSPQGLNNWGLALQELSAIVPYGLAEDTSRTGGSIDVEEVSSNELFSQSAIYIVAAHALKLTYSISASCCFKLRKFDFSVQVGSTLACLVYASLLKLVRSMIGIIELNKFLLIFVKDHSYTTYQNYGSRVGYLTAPPVGNPVAPHSDWKRTQFILNHEGIQQVSTLLLIHGEFYGHHVIITIRSKLAMDGTNFGNSQRITVTPCPTSEVCMDDLGHIKHHYIAIK